MEIRESCSGPEHFPDVSFVEEDTAHPLQSIPVRNEPCESLEATLASLPGVVKSLTTGLKEVQADNQQLCALLTHQSPTTEIPLPSTSDGRTTASGVTLPELHAIQHLSQLADQRVAQLGLADSSDSDLDHDEVEPSTHVCAKDKSGSNGGGKSLKSGKESKITTTVLYPQLWLHSFLSLRNAHRDIKYDDLMLEEFVAGYGQILQFPNIAETERSTRLKQLVSLVYFAQQYEWQAILSFHGSVLLEIKQGLLKWGDSLFHLESRTLYGHPKKPKSATSGGSSTSSNTVLNCQDFQQQHCSFNQAHYGYLCSKKLAAAYLLRLLGAIKKTRAPLRWLVQIYLCKFGDKKLTTSNTFVHHAESVDERVPCFSKEVEHDILSSSFDRFQEAVAPFDCTETVSGSRSSSWLSFSTIFLASCGKLFLSGCS